MILVRPSYDIIDFPSTPLEQIEVVARTCYKSHDKIGPGSSVKMARMLKERHHSAMLEFGGDPIVKFVCDRGVSHELVRHRLCSFAQESTRYCNYTKDKFGNQLTFVIPPWFAEHLRPGEYQLHRASNLTSVEYHDEDVPMWNTICTNVDSEYEEDGIVKLELYSWLKLLLIAEEEYLYLVGERGESPQQARAVLPNSLKTEICVKANTREWMHIFSQRCNPAAHPQMLELMIPLAKEFAALCDVLYEEWA